MLYFSKIERRIRIKKRRILKSKTKLKQEDNSHNEHKKKVQCYRCGKLGLIKKFYRTKMIEGMLAPRSVTTIDGVEIKIFVLPLLL